MQSSSPLQPPSTVGTADADGSRRLNDDVLQSAEDAFLVEATAPGLGSYSSDASPARSADFHAPAPYPALSSYDAYQKAVGQYVAARPLQSALMAGAAGALAALLLRSRWRKRTGLRRWPRVR